MTNRVSIRNVNPSVGEIAEAIRVLQRQIDTLANTLASIDTSGNVQEPEEPIQTIEPYTYRYDWLLAIPNEFNPTDHDASKVTTGIFPYDRLPISAAEVTNWNQAYDDTITGLSGTGNSVLILTRITSTDLTVDLSHTHTISEVTGLQSELDSKIPKSDKGTATGVATLDSNAKIPLVQLPDSILGQVEYQGTWNADTNTPTLPDPTTVKGHYYVASTGGVFSSHTFAVGDWVISDGVKWDKVDNTDAVTSVAGRTGAVTLTAADIGGLAIVATSGSYTDLSDVPSSFPPEPHNHDSLYVKKTSDTTYSNLGSAIGDEVVFTSFLQSGSNSSRIIVKDVRTDDATTGWNTAGTRIQKRIDTTDMGFIEFNGLAGDYNVAIGSREVGADAPNIIALFNRNGNVTVQGTLNAAGSYIENSSNLGGSTTPNSSHFGFDVVSGTAGIGIGQNNGDATIQAYGTGTAYNLHLNPTAGSVFVRGINVRNAILFNAGTLQDARLSSNVNLLGADQTVTGSKTFTDEIRSDRSGNIQRWYSGGNPYGLIWRYDTTSLYLLNTASGDNLGSWDGKRPFIYKPDTGGLTFNAGSGNSEGVVVGAPIGGHPSSGAINAEQYFKDNIELNPIEQGYTELRPADSSWAEDIELDLQRQGKVCICRFRCYCNTSSPSGNQNLGTLIPTAYRPHFSSGYFRIPGSNDVEDSVQLTVSSGGTVILEPNPTTTMRVYSTVVCWILL